MVNAWKVLSGDDLAKNIDALETIDFIRKTSIVMLMNLLKALGQQQTKKNGSVVK
ncbi:hypothetical protein GCM10022393_42610 [Aquimarina addita]|uniref:Uncharacterized protein n=1 Tax=Aquimarina addita TaxID=870485 RepID=A0ABP6UW20_9FLAO